MQVYSFICISYLPILALYPYVTHVVFHNVKKLCYCIPLSTNTQLSIPHWGFIHTSSVLQQFIHVIHLLKLFDLQLLWNVSLKFCCLPNKFYWTARSIVTNCKSGHQPCASYGPVEWQECYLLYFRTLLQN